MWHTDYEDGDLYLDQPPDQVRELGREMGVPESYLAAVAEDLADEQVGDRVAE